MTNYSNTEFERIRKKAEELDDAIFATEEDYERLSEQFDAIDELNRDLLANGIIKLNY